MTRHHLSILLLNHNVRGKSTYFRCLHFGTQLVARGHEVTLLTISPAARVGFHEDVQRGIRILETPDLLSGRLRSGWDFWDTACRIAWLGRRRFDLIHAFDCRPVVIFPALFARYLQHTPLIIDWADWWGRGGVIKDRAAGPLNRLFEPVETYFEEAFRRYADGWTVTSRALRARAAGLGLPEERVLYLPSGCDVEFIRPLDKGAARRELGLPINTPIVEFVGFVLYDLAFAVQAFAHLHRTRPDARLLLVGAVTDEIRHQAVAQGVADAIIEAGPQPFTRVPSYLAAADVLLMPFTDRLANIGRWPIKVGDYMAAGRPIVTSPVGDMPLLFTHEQIGLLAPDQPAPFAQAVGRLLADPVLAEKLGQNARRVAEERYAWSRLTPLLESYYFDVLSRCGHFAISNANLP
ncbi:MAG: glycosyltransferase family 4 protein [Ardenticatenaceae bacterium]|nr:glycosyltransferase family 4 protein [Ardenticatenaceae bacterium]